MIFLLKIFTSEIIHATNTNISINIYGGNSNNCTFIERKQVRGACLWFIQESVATCERIV